jgi:hypothetical protein
MAAKGMHQTTVRFGADLWDTLEREATRLGVSVAQYIREAALARVVYAAGQRGDDQFDVALELALGGQQEPARVPQPEGMLRQARDVPGPVGRAQVEVSDAAALWAQGRQVRRRAQELRDAIAARRHAQQARRV